MSAILDRNLAALSDPVLSRLISSTNPSPMIGTTTSRNGLPVPVELRAGRPYPLHSTMDPIQEACRLHDSFPSSGFIVFLGLGGGYQIAPFLEDPGVAGAIVVEIDASVLRSFLSAVDMSRILGDPRVSILLDPPEGSVEAAVLSAYLPAVMGGFCSVPLRSRTTSGDRAFKEASAEVERAAGRAAADYAAQARFGKRWFSHTLANLPFVKAPSLTPPRSGAVLIAGAGPSLEAQIPHMKTRRGGSLLVSSDTALPVLLSYGVLPDIAMSIDCQQYGYHHALSCRAGKACDVPFLLDLASPPSLVHTVPVTGFFSSGHPFSRLAGAGLGGLPVIDTSGGNVSYAAVSLARLLGAQEIVLYGVDYSYPDGTPYARGTYLTHHFLAHAGRMETVEDGFFRMVFGGGPVQRETIEGGFRWSNGLLRSYHAAMEDLLVRTEARITVVPGRGLPITTRGGARAAGGAARSGRQASASPGTAYATRGWRAFLEAYRADVAALPPATTPLRSYFRSLSPARRATWATILPIVPCIENESGGGPSDRATLLSAARNWALSRMDRLV